MKVTVENKKNLEKNLKVFVDKTTINKELELRYEQIKKDVEKLIYPNHLKYLKKLKAQLKKDKGMKPRRNWNPFRKRK